MGQISDLDIWRADNLLIGPARGSSLKPRASKI
jgi:hypothetical protein